MTIKEPTDEGDKEIKLLSFNAWSTRRHLRQNDKYDLQAGIKYGTCTN